MMIKAVNGGGGRGMRAVRKPDEVAEAYARCRSEAKAAFGDDSVYVERLVEDARHIEVQIVGDSAGAVTHFGERECTIQRRNQKLIEIAPSPSLTPVLRERILDAALIKLASAAKYDNLGTFEFLVDASSPGDDAFFAFIEANPRLQVEHTVTEEVMGIDLVATQIRIAAGRSLKGMGLLDRKTTATRLCDPAPYQHGDDGQEGWHAAPAAARSRLSTCRPAPAFASIRSATPAIAPARRSTRCWRS